MTEGQRTTRCVQNEENGSARDLYAVVEMGVEGERIYAWFAFSRPQLDEGRRVLLGIRALIKLT